MSVTNYGFLAWEEHIVCHERGSRVVHYYLKDAVGDSVLAVVGTERSIRHMIYVVSNEYLQAYGSNMSINASTKWRARRDVVDWLTSMVSIRRPPLGVSDARMNSLEQGSGTFKESVAGFSACQTNISDQMVRRKLKAQNSDVEWSGVACVCTKQLKHYPGFHRNGTTIAVHSFVFIMADEESHYLGYLEDMYEDKKGQKKVKVRWFHHNEEVKAVIPHLNTHPREVFITPHVQVISAECVDGLATVLTPRHYEKCVAIVPHISPSRVHMCFRQYKKNKVKPFSLTKLRGYCNQAILSSLDGPLFPKQKAKYHNLSKEDGEELTHDEPVRVGGKRNRGSRGYRGLESGFGLQISAPGNQRAKLEPAYPKLKLRLSRKSMGIEFVVPPSQCPILFRVNDRIELLCQDSGIRGCWFRCKVLQASQKRLKVQYDDVQDVEGSGNLEEWVPACQVAAADKLGLRCSGRLTIRPHPPIDSTNCLFEVGAPVDAWWSDGWWEGVVSGVGISANDCLQVYLPGESKFLPVQRENVRTSRDWVDNKWVDVKAKSDIFCSLSANAIFNIKVEATGCGSAIPLERKVVTTSKLEAIEEDEPSPGSMVSDDSENVDKVSLNQGPIVNYEDVTDICKGGHKDVDDDDGDDKERKNYVSDNNDDVNDIVGNMTELLLEKDLESAKEK